jgi:hypothetical protein
MTDRREKSVRILEQNAETLAQAKDEEYAYWQRRPPLERLEAMLDLSYALFGPTGDEPDLRQRMLQNPRILPCPWLTQEGEKPER